MIRRLFVAVACAAVLSACSQPANEAATTETPAAEETTAAAEAPVAQDIVDTAVANGSFSTLVAAIQAAGLADALKAPGPFTVFAPTDAAFAALPAGTLDNLLKPENKDQLVKILQYHVVSGETLSSAITAAAEVDTLAGAKLKLEPVNGQVKVGDATVTQADVDASNGVIHVIDKVLMPPAA